MIKVESSLERYNKLSINTTPTYTYTIGTGTGIPTYTFHPSITTTQGIDYTNNSPSTLQVQGDAEFKGDVKLRGKSLLKLLEKFEERLAILHPNEELEEKWEQLRGLRKMYMELEQEIIEKEKMWATLKK